MTISLQNTKSSFEVEVVEQLQLLIAALPAGSASLRVLPESPEWSCRYFEVIPANDRAAKLTTGVVLDDLHLAIGEVEREFIGFRRGGTIVPGWTWLDDLRWIWRVVIAGGFSQQQYLDREGNVIGGASILRLEGITYDFRGGRVAETLFGERNCRTVSYEPYWRSSLTSAGKPPNASG